MDYKKIFTLREVNNGFVIKKYKAKDTIVNIPDTIEDKKVIAIDDMAFKGKEIEEITIPDSIIAIGERAFCDCKKLKKVYLNHKVGMERFVFAGCEALADENGYVIVGNVLHDYYGKESKLVLPEEVQIIDDSAFEKARRFLEEVTIPKSVEQVRCNAFYGCKKLQTVIVMSEETRMEASSFDGCEKLVDEAGFIILNGCLCAYREKDVEKVELPSAVNRIAKDSLAHLKKTKEIVIPEGVKTIYEYAFFYSESLETIHIPASVTNIEKNAFVGCKNMIVAQTGAYALEYAKENNISFIEE